METLTESQMQRAQLLLDFLKITKGGLTKPYDPIPIINKIEKYEHNNQVDLTELKKCCPQSATIEDAKDFKPFIMAALDQFAEVMGLKLNNG